MCRKIHRRATFAGMPHNMSIPHGKTDNFRLERYQKLLALQTLNTDTAELSGGAIALLGQ